MAKSNSTTTPRDLNTADDQLGRARAMLDMIQTALGDVKAGAAWLEEMDEQTLSYVVNQAIVHIDCARKAMYPVQAS